MKSQYKKNKFKQDTEFQEMRNAMKSNYEVQIDQLEKRNKKLRLKLLNQSNLQSSTEKQSN